MEPASDVGVPGLDRDHRLRRRAAVDGDAGFPHRRRMSRDPLVPQFAALHAEVADIAAAGILLALRQRILRRLANRQIRSAADFSRGAPEPVSDLVKRAAQLLAEIEQARTAAERLDRRMLH